MVSPHPAQRLHASAPLRPRLWSRQKVPRKGSPASQSDPRSPARISRTRTLHLPPLPKRTALPARTPTPPRPTIMNALTPFNGNLKTSTSLAGGKERAPKNSLHDLKSDQIEHPSYFANLIGTRRHHKVELIALRSAPQPPRRTPQRHSDPNMRRNSLSGSSKSKTQRACAKG